MREISKYTRSTPLFFSMNKYVFGIAVTGIPMAIALAGIFGLFGSTGGVLTPDVRPDHQTPAVTVLNVEIKTVAGSDKLLNLEGEPNGDFVSCIACTLRLVITNNGAKAHDISVPDTGTSTGPIKPGETKSIDIITRSYGTLTYQDDTGDISGQVKIVRVS